MPKLWHTEICLEIQRELMRVLLRERLKEFMFEGKRWYDLRRFGKDYVMKYSSLKMRDIYYGLLTKIP